MVSKNALWKKIVMSKKSTSSKFIDGCIVSPGSYFFTSRLDLLPEGEYGQGLLSLFNNGAFQFSLRDQQVESVCIDRNASEPILCAVPRFDPRVGYYDNQLVSLRDEVYTSDSANMATSVRNINNHIYVACMDGKVYKNSNGRWELFNAGLEAEDLSYLLAGDSLSVEILTRVFQNSVNITAINGSAKVLYAGTSSGDVFSCRESEWEKLPTGTKGLLSGITLKNETDAYVVGHRGTLLMVSELGVSPISHEIKDSFICSTMFDGEFYFGGFKGLYKIENGVPQKVFHMGRDDFTCFALDSHAGEMLVTGDRWFCVYDGRSWHRETMPGNENQL